MSSRWKTATSRWRRRTVASSAARVLFPAPERPSMPRTRTGLVATLGHGVGAHVVEHSRDGGVDHLPAQAEIRRVAEPRIVDALVLERGRGQGGVEGAHHAQF